MTSSDGQPGRAGTLAVTGTFALLTLAACGGGSGGGGELSILDNWQRYEAGNPTLRMTAAQIEEAYQSRSKRASHDLILSFGGPVDGDESIVVEVDQHQHEDLLDLPPGSTVSFAPVLGHIRIPIAQTKARVIAEDEDDGETYLTEILTYAGWLDQTVFGVTFAAQCDVDEPGCSGPSPAFAWGGAWAITPYGVYSGTTPAGMGSATWTGVMIGMESPKLEDPAAAQAWVRQGSPDVYLGDARIAIGDLAAPDVDVSFTGIHNVTEGTRHRDLSWEGLPVENGLFGSGDSDDYIAGMFTGPRHQEVGGEFQRDGIAGGFGAKRQ